MQINVKKVKVTVMVPRDYTNKIKSIIEESDAEHIGNYDKCLTITHCISSFSPNDKAHPFIGKSNKISVVEEDKIEFICDINKVKEVVEVIKANHPYEEVEVDIYPLIDLVDLL